MLKKARAQSGSSSDVRKLAQSVIDSSRQIWLAGLGAFAKAQQEGSKVFESLVQQGVEIESKTRSAAAETADAAREVAKAKAKEVQAIAGGTWDKLEQVFEERVARALSRLGVHTSADVDRLTERVNALSQSVDALLKATRGSAGAASANDESAEESAAPRKRARKRPSNVQGAAASAAPPAAPSRRRTRRKPQ